MAIERYDKPYLDSSVFIAWINREVIDGVNRFEIADHIINQAAGGTHPIYISALTLAEVNKIPRSKVAALTPEQNQVLIKFFQNDYFKLLPVDRMIGEMANSFCREYGIMGNDAIHLACALRAKCDALLVWDRPLSSKVTRTDIRVEPPQILGQRSLVSYKVSPPTGDDAPAETVPGIAVTPPVPLTAPAAPPIESPPAELTPLRTEAPKTEPSPRVKE